MCAACRVSCSDHFQWKRSTGMPQLVLHLRIDLAVAISFGIISPRPAKQTNEP